MSIGMLMVELLSTAYWIAVAIVTGWIFKITMFTLIGEKTWWIKTLALIGFCLVIVFYLKVLSSALRHIKNWIEKRVG
jgi:hypothetical protein